MTALELCQNKFSFRLGKCIAVTIDPLFIFNIVVIQPLSSWLSLAIFAVKRTKTVSAEKATMTAYYALFEKSPLLWDNSMGRFVSVNSKRSPIYAEKVCASHRRLDNPG